MTEALMITEKDFTRIKHYITAQKAADFDDLEYELDRAQIIKETEAPSDLVTMNSRVRYLNLDTNKESEITIVYPKDANLSEGRVSVLASLGSALIGLREGEVIDWTFPDDSSKKLKVIKVLEKPEK